MKKIFIFVAFTVVSYISFKFITRTDKPSGILISGLSDSKDDSMTQQLQAEVIEVEKLIELNADYSPEIGFFINMHIPSMKNRFFIYDFKKDKIIDQGLVAHGSGSETGIKGKLKFSNINNSLSTSFGKYSIGKSYNGKFGKAYKLYGLDETNSNAFMRNIVLHKYEAVPYKEQENYICNSYGCPMVNEKFYKRIEKIIDASDKKIILSIFY